MCAYVCVCVWLCVCVFGCVCVCVCVCVCETTSIKYICFLPTHTCLKNIACTSLSQPDYMQVRQTEYLCVYNCDRREGKTVRGRDGHNDCVSVQTSTYILDCRTNSNHKHHDKPDFPRTTWTMRCVRLLPADHLDRALCNDFFPRTLWTVHCVTTSSHGPSKLCIV